MDDFLLWYLFWTDCNARAWVTNSFCLQKSWFLWRQLYTDPEVKWAPKHAVYHPLPHHILPYLASWRKTIIRCWTVNQVSQVFSFIWQMQPNGANKLIWARVYHSICPADYNKQTIELFKAEPHLQIVISTVAFSNGLNAKSLLDSLSLGFGEIFNESWQEKCHVGRDPNTTGQGVIFAHCSVIKEAELSLAHKCHCFYP